MIAVIAPISPQRARVFQRRLLEWYEKHGRDLPWRHTRDPYAILVSELMLQQTQVSTVIPYYGKWIKRFPDFRTLAAASESEVLHAWQGLGYYARARNLHAAAHAVVSRHDAVFPASPEESRQLPGIGRYTANAVATFAFDQGVPVVEANTARLLARILNLQVRIDSVVGREWLWSFAATLVPKRNAALFNSALMDLGAMVCVTGAPRCSLCPVRGFCRAPNPALLPLKGGRAATKRLTEHHLFAVRRGRILLEQSQTRWRGMWILPRLESEPATRRLVHSATFPFTHHQITLAAYSGGDLPPPAISQRWFALAQLNSIPLPSPHRRAVTALLAAKGQKLCSTLAAN